MENISNLQQNLQIHFLARNLLYLYSKFMKFVTEGPMNNKPVLIPKMACHQTGNKPLPALIWA